MPVHHRCFRVPLPPQELRLLSPMVLPVVLPVVLSLRTRGGFAVAPAGPLATPPAVAAPCGRGAASLAQRRGLLAASRPARPWGPGQTREAG